MKLLWNLPLWFRKATEVRHVAGKFLHGNVERPLHAGKSLHGGMEKPLHAGKSLHGGTKRSLHAEKSLHEAWRGHCMKL